MNSNDKILEVLLKISESLDEIKTHMTSNTSSQVINAKKIEETKQAVQQVVAAKSEPKPEPKPEPTKVASTEDFYNAFIEKFVKPLLEATKNLGEKFTPVYEMIDSLFVGMLHDIIKKSFVCKKPSDSEIQSLFAPVKVCNDKLTLLNKDRDFPLNYVKCMTEIISSVNWVLIPEEPDIFVATVLDSATFWMNKIRRDARDKNDAKQQDFCKLLIAMMKELIAIIENRYKTGFTWNTAGIDIKDYKEAAVETPAETPAVETPSAKDSASSIRDELAKMFMKRKEDGGLDLKHVEKDQMSHKNPALRGNVKMVEKNEKYLHGTSIKYRAKLAKPPRCELVQSKWMVENQTEQCEVTSKMNETIYILGCVGATIRIPSKCKSIIVDGCKKTNVIFNKCVSTCEIVNCKQCKVQCLENVPTVAVDKTDGCTIFFPRSCLETIRILTSKCSDMNVSFPSAEDEQDWVERAIPEQYVHTIKGDQVDTAVSDLYSA